MESILVTGGCGFIGSNFINTFHEKNPDVQIINIDKIDYCSNIHNVKKGAAKLVKGNIHNKELLINLIEEYKFKSVFHFAAQSHVDNSFNDPLSFTIENVYGTHVLIETFRQYQPSVEFIHFSTDEVYGQSVNDKIFFETDTLNPTNPYSASKAAAEMCVNSYIESFTMNIKIVRCNNVYGINQYPEKIIPKFLKLLHENKKCTIHGTNSSCIKRAFINIEDVINGVDMVWKNGKNGEIYNISSNNEITIFELAKIIIKIVKKTDDYIDWIEYVEDRPFNDERYFINSEKLCNLGWKPKNSFKELISFIEKENEKFQG